MSCQCRPNVNDRNQVKEEKFLYAYLKSVRYSAVTKFLVTKFCKSVCGYNLVRISFQNAKKITN